MHDADHVHLAERGRAHDLGPGDRHRGQHRRDAGVHDLHRGPDGAGHDDHHDLQRRPHEHRDAVDRVHDDGTDDAAEDADDDGLSNAGEIRAGTNPRDTDSDDDGTNDAAEDADGDGVSNEVEDYSGTNPGDDDSDDDGVKDGSEAAGAIVSYVGGVLVFRQGDGTEVSGLVDGSTELECVVANGSEAEGDACLPLLVAGSFVREIEFESGAAPQPIKKLQLGAA
ncbi:unannotated protein [freshwater metagenome]|uniref:Unannotated protein n=1 Tax=freshwater metagenome TaxID=449393 RepID=A0A6J7HB75_9ZZZZ|nr:hypothetical protein [Actinomycetota bacterium]